MRYIIEVEGGYSWDVEEAARELAERVDTGDPFKVTVLEEGEDQHTVELASWGRTADEASAAWGQS